MSAILKKCEWQRHCAEEARRQVQRQLVMIDRQIWQRMAALIPQLEPKTPRHGRAELPDPKAFLERYRLHFAALAAERQPEIDALSRKLARQDRALAETRRQRNDLGQTRLEEASLARDDYTGSYSSVGGAFEHQPP